MTSRRAFGSTYRLQLNGFGFAAARDLVPFLADLGIETVYLSPITQARSGSSHGYDVTDFAAVDGALGGRAGLDDLLAAAARHDLTVLLDIVPNHMAASTENRYFCDVLTHGTGSRFAAYFDIAWDEHGGKVMLPVLGAPLDQVLAAGDLHVVAGATGGHELSYFEQRFPLDPATCVDDLLAPDRLRELIAAQHYLLADWRQANRELNYRRFFDINELIGIRQEDPAVFAATHELIVDLVADPRVAGVRVDHVDGLRDPAGYLTMLRSAIGPAPVIEIEKILERDEALRPWPVDGTSGYEFAVAVTGLFIDPDGAATLAADLAGATGDQRTFGERALVAKRSVVGSRFPHLVEQITEPLAIALPDIDPSSLAATVAELAVQLAAYRTYRTGDEALVAADHELIVAAGRGARAALPSTASAAVDAVVSAFTNARLDPSVLEAIARWQQLSPPATAKGVEDTAIYEPGQLLAAADVGSDPDRPSTSAVAFHAAMTDRQRRWPRAMSTLSTHDSKRSHDARRRLAVLSELPGRWAATVGAVEATMAAEIVPAGPDITQRRFLYETLIAIWPLDDAIDDDLVGRVRDHMTKAGREAKRRSDWIDPDPVHEAAVGEFVTQLLCGADDRARRGLAGFAREVEVAGATNALASVLIRSMAPGVPDVYQGDDSWCTTLVDPDNRRGLDVRAHTDSLRGLPRDPSTAALSELRNGWRDGRLKQYVVQQSLCVRRRLGDSFVAADYSPVPVVGAHADYVVAFARRTHDYEVVCLVPRLTRSLVGADEFPLGDAVWADTAVVLPTVDGGRWMDRIGGRVHAADGALTVGSVLSELPVALLERA